MRPDGYGRWCHHPRHVEFFLEYDRGTEPLHRLTAKLRAYTDLADATGITTPTLIWLPEHAAKPTSTTTTFNAGTCLWRSRPPATATPVARTISTGSRSRTVANQRVT